MGGLSFDRDQRYQTLCEIARRLGVKATDSVLDVGGGTGELGAMLGCESFWTADLIGGGPRHVSSSMEQLPFADDSFDLVVQADALEHVPQALRHTALVEMARVSRSWLIWIGPVESPEAVEAEEDLCMLHKSLFGGREMDWLTEHRRHGLPSSDQVVRSLSPHFSDWRWWRSCTVRKWWRLKRLELQLATGPYSPLFEEAFNAWYSGEGWKSDYHLSDEAPAYRSVFVGCKQGILPEGIQESPAPGALAVEGGLLAGLAAAIAGGVGLDLEGHPRLPAAASQLERIATLIEAQTQQRPVGLISRLLGR